MGELHVSLAMSSFIGVNEMKKILVATDFSGPSVSGSLATRDFDTMQPGLRSSLSHNLSGQRITMTNRKPEAKHIITHCVH